MIDRIGVNGVYKYLPIAQNANSMMFICHKLVTARAACGSESTTARIIPLSYRKFYPGFPRFLVCNEEEFRWLAAVANGDVSFLTVCKELSIYDQAD